MNQNLGVGLVILAVAAIFAFYVLVQLKSGISYLPYLVQRFERKTDPFGYWPGTVLYSAVAIILGVGGFVTLFHF